MATSLSHETFGTMSALSSTDSSHKKNTKTTSKNSAGGGLGSQPQNLGGSNLQQLEDDEDGGLSSDQNSLKRGGAKKLSDVGVGPSTSSGASEEKQEVAYSDKGGAMTKNKNLQIT